jgi:hypothetical protein
MEYIKLNIIGAVRLLPTFSLSETAAKLEAALGNLVFRQDLPGKYDEFPSFSAEAAGLKFALLGIPDPEEQILGPVESFCLQIGMAFRTDDAKEPCDASTYFAELIRSRSDLSLAGTEC